MKQMFALLRILLLALMLYFLFPELSLVQLKTVIIQCDWGLLLIALVFYMLRYVIQGVRWHNAAMAYGLNSSAFFFIKSQIEIAFLEMIFPIPDPEDALRVIKLRETASDTGKSAAIMLFDRIMGLLFLVILLPFSFWFVSGFVFKDVAINKLLLGIMALTLLALSIFYRTIFLQAIKIAEKLFSLKYAFIESLKKNIALKINIRYQILGMFWVVAFGVTGTSCIWLLARSLGADVSFLSLLLCIPFFYISQTFPISYQGLGIYEATVVFILQQMGMPLEKALALGSVHFFFHFLIILCGGIIFTANPSKINLPLLQTMRKKTG